MEVYLTGDPLAALAVLDTLSDTETDVQALAVDVLRLRIARDRGDADEVDRTCTALIENTCAQEGPGRALVASRVASVEHHRGNHAVANTLMLEAVAIYDALGWNHEAALTTCDLAAFRQREGDFAGASYLYLSVMDEIRANGTERQRMSVTNNLATVLLQSGSLHTAEPLFREALAADIRDPITRSTMMQSLAIIAKLDGRFDESEELYRQALSLLDPGLYPTQRLRLTCGMADVAVRRGRVDEAMALLDSIRAEDLEAATASTRSNILVLRAQILGERGDEDEAMRIIARARRELAEIRSYDELYRVLIDALGWARAPHHRQDLLEEYYRMAEDRLTQVTASVQSVIDLRTRFDQERAARELQRQQDVTRAIIETQTRTMNEIGRELHDSLGQDLTVASMLVERLVTRESLSTADVDRIHETLRDVTRRAARDARRISHLVSGHGLTGAGLPDAMATLRADVEVSAPSLTIEMGVVGDTTLLSDDEARALYRILQTLVQNVLRHADARTCIVQLIVDEARVQLSVEDDGRGFDPSTVERGLGMRELTARAALIGASVHVDSTPGHGSFISITITR
jgi:signal transduction histidine kinase